MSLVEDISAAIQKGKKKDVTALVQQAIDEGVDAKAILSDGLLAGMNIVGERFKKDEIFVPEVLVAARAMNAGTQLLKPLLADADAKPLGKAVIGTVKGDLHDIGKNLVRMMIEGKGIEVIDIGVDVAPEDFIKAAVENDAQIICCSALLTTTMPMIGEVVKAAEAAGIRDKVTIMIGGAPVNQEFCDSVNADIYTADAASAA
ncbi:MAG: cobalamin-binding protein, partial [Lachnospiraceae bacterium]|nr:cobalamin-binding protein [Lachnospiraceae bacterium]